MQVFHVYIRYIIRVFIRENIFCLVNFIWPAVFRLIQYRKLKVDELIYFFKLLNGIYKFQIYL